MLELEAGAEPVPHCVTREEIFVALEGEARATLDGVAHVVRGGRDAGACRRTCSSRSTASGSTPFRALVCLPVGGQAVVAGGDPFTPPWAE